MDDEAETNANGAPPELPADLGKQAASRSGLGTLLARQKTRLQNLSALVILNFVIAGLGIITAVKVANVMGKAKFGQLAYVLAIGMYFGTIVRFGSDRALVKELVHYKDRLGQMVVASLVLRGGILVAAAGTLLLWQLSDGGPLSMPLSGIVIILCMALAATTVAPVYDVWGKMSWNAVMMLIQRCIYVGIAWLAILLNRLSLGWIACAVAVSVAVRLAIEFSWAFRRMDFSGRMEIGRHVWHLAGAGWLFWLASIAGLCSTTLNQLILRGEYGDEALGGYAASWRLAFVVVLLVNQIARIGRPAAARATVPGVSLARQVRFLLAYSGVMVAVAGVFSMPAILFPKTIMGLLFKEEYVEAAPILRVLAIYVVFLVVGMVTSQYIISKGMQKTYFTSVMIGGGVSVLVCWLMIPRYAGVGAALALLMGHGTAMILYAAATVWVLVKQSGQQPAPELIDSPAVEPGAMSESEE